MKRKLRRYLMAAFMLLFMMSLASAPVQAKPLEAANGPGPYAELKFVPTTDYDKYMIANEWQNDINVHNSLEGVVYNKITNTLTLTNVELPGRWLAVYKMGYTFKLEVKGKNRLAGIIVYGMSDSVYTWGDHSYDDVAALEIIGDGTLVLNEYRSNDWAIVLKLSKTDGGKFASGLTVANTVHLTAHRGKGGVIDIREGEKDVPPIHVPKSLEATLTLSNDSGFDASTGYYNWHYINETITTEGKNICTVRFNANGGTKLSQRSKEVTSGNAIGTLPTASRPGYALKGWYTKQSGGSKVTPGTKITKDQTLYAQWAKAYTVKFNANGGKNLSSKSIDVASGNAIGTLPTVSKKNYTFNGWYTKKSGGSKVTSKTKITKSQTLYAQWTKASSVGKKKYTVKFNANDGTKLSKKSLSVASGMPVGKLPTVGRKNYTFNGWYTKRSGGSKVTSKTKITKSQTLYAQWSKIGTKQAPAPTVKKAGSGKISVKLKKVSGAKGYQIAYSTSSKFKNSESVMTTSLSKTISRLKRAKYYVRVRAYKTDSQKNKVYGKYSKAVWINVR